MEIKVYKIKDKHPEDGQECWVIRKEADLLGYPTMQVYNEDYNCWDDYEGDDFDFEVDEEDIWMELPSQSLIIEAYESQTK